MDIKIILKWNKEVTIKFKKLSENDLVSAKNKILLTAAKLIQQEAKKLVPNKSWTLNKSIKYKLFKDHAQVYSNLSYAKYVHEWTKPHLIKPLTKKSLYREKDWIWYFSKLVHHPWTKANPFFETALENMENEIIKRCNEILQSAINNL
jgi:HK97 gp10 family phage protein